MVYTRLTDQGRIDTRTPFSESPPQEDLKQSVSDSGEVSIDDKG